MSSSADVRAWLMLFGGGVLLVGIALHVAWIGKRADAKGRNVLAWVVLGVGLSVVGVRLGLTLFERAATLSSDLLTVVYITSPLTLGFAPLIATVLVLMALPVRVAPSRAWPIHETQHGSGTLAIGPNAIVLRWATSTDRIPRSGVAAEADGEIVRLRWRDGETERELVVMPTGKPANREGRMRQAEVIAACLRA